MTLINILPLRSCLLLGLLALLTTAAMSADPFRVENKPPTSGIVTRSSEPINENFRDSPMLAALSGYLGELDARDFVALRRGLDGEYSDASPPEPYAYVRMQRSGLDDALVAFTLHNDGVITVHAVDAQRAFFEIDPKVLETRIPRAAAPAQLVEGNETDEESRRIELTQPYVSSPIVLDARTRRARIRANYKELTRDLENETMHIRLPRGYDSEVPAGILVWISPSPDWRTPRIFEMICDELGFICIGADNNGNDRNLSDRLQIHLDSIETLASRYKIDRKRVYLTGMSGGGRCSGILQCSFPEIFAGAVPIVGLDSYHNAPTGKGKEYWPAKLGKPPARYFKLLKQRRIAAITGSVDFNEPEMTIRTNLMLRDKLQIRLNVIEGMGHTMPTSEQFADALRWVDELRRASLAEEHERAQQLWIAFNETYPEADPNDPEQRTALIEITAASPWSDPAWSAAEMLGFERPE